MAREYVKITTEPEIRKGQRGTSFRFRIPAHHGKPASKSPWRKAKGKKKGEIAAEAEAYRQELEEEINDWGTRGDMPLGEYARRWHEARQEKIAVVSWEREEIIIKQIEGSDLGKIPIQEIEPEDIEEQKAKNKKAKWSEDKQRRYIRTVKQITKEAGKKRSIKHDPGALVDDVKAEKHERRAVPSLVIGQMLLVLDETPKNGKTAATRIALGTGYRRGELLGLEWKDIDLKRGTINLQRQLTSKGEIKPPKYDSTGMMPIDPDLVEWLKDWQAISRQRWGIAGTLPVCCNDEGKHLIPSNFDRWRRQFFADHGWGTFEKVEKTRDAKGNPRTHRTGFKGWKLHEIRHAMATELLGNGADLRTTQAIMRHKRITTTEGYIHEIPQNVRAAMKGMADTQKRARGAAEYAEATNATGDWSYRE